MRVLLALLLVTTAPIPARSDAGIRSVSRIVPHVIVIPSPAHEVPGFSRFAGPTGGPARHRRAGAPEMAIPRGASAAIA